MKLVLSMFYALLSPDNHLSLTRNTNSVTSKSSIVCCSSKLLCSGCCQHRISTQRNRDYLHWPHSKWRPVGYHSYFKEGVVLERVYCRDLFFFFFFFGLQLVFSKFFWSSTVFQKGAPPLSKLEPPFWKSCLRP